MTTEKLEKAKQLVEFIDELKYQKSRWENAQSIHKLELSTTIKRCNDESVTGTDEKYVNFEELRCLTIARINKRLEMLQSEFDNL